jgi:hypothetical protein
VDGGLQLGLIGVAVEGGVGGDEVVGGGVTGRSGKEQPTLRVRDRMRIRGIIRYFVFTRFIAFQL